MERALPRWVNNKAKLLKEAKINDRGNILNWPYSDPWFSLFLKLRRLLVCEFWATPYFLYDKSDFWLQLFGAGFLSLLIKRVSMKTLLVIFFSFRFLTLLLIKKKKKSSKKCWSKLRKSSVRDKPGWSYPNLEKFRLKSSWCENRLSLWQKP